MTQPQATREDAERGLCRDDGRCQYAIDHGAEGMGHCPKDKCAYAVKNESERDLAHEADMRELMRQQLRDNITPEEAEEELAEYEDRNDFIEGYDGDDQFCSCSVEHGIEELDSNQCDCCGKDIA